MKQIRSFLLAVGLVVTSGCISTHLVKERARPHLEYSLEEQQLIEAPGEPGYCALLPLTIAGDIATSPVQIGYFLFTHDHSAGANIHGVPVPLP